MNNQNSSEIIEVKNQKELLEALDFDFVSRILLDNMTPSTVTAMSTINQQRK